MSDGRSGNGSGVAGTVQRRFWSNPRAAAVVWRSSPSRLDFDSMHLRRTGAPRCAATAMHRHVDPATLAALMPESQLPPVRTRRRRVGPHRRRRRQCHRRGDRRGTRLHDHGTGCVRSGRRRIRNHLDARVPPVTIDGYVEMPGRGLPATDSARVSSTFPWNTAEASPPRSGTGPSGTPGARGRPRPGFGSLRPGPVADLVEPAYELARDGFPLSQDLRATTSVTATKSSSAGRSRAGRHCIREAAHSSTGRARAGR